MNSTLHRFWEILKHPVTSLAVGLVIALATFYFSRATKEPSYSITVPKFIAKTSENASKLTLLWDGQIVSNVASVELALWNAGAQYIDAMDIATTDPIRIVPYKRIRILAADPIRTSRGNLRFATKIVFDEKLEKDVIQVNLIGDDALEKNDGAVIQILYSGEYCDDFSVEGRIKGASSGFIKKDWTNSEFKALPRVVLYSTFALTALVIVYFILLYRRQKQFNAVTFSVLALVFLYVGLSAYLAFIAYAKLPSWIFS